RLPPNRHPLRRDRRLVPPPQQGRCLTFKLLGCLSTSVMAIGTRGDPLPPMDGYFEGRLSRCSMTRYERFPCSAIVCDVLGLPPGAHRSWARSSRSRQLVIEATVSLSDRTYRPRSGRARCTPSLGRSWWLPARRWSGWLVW